MEGNNALSYIKLPTEVWHETLEHILCSIAQFSLDSDPINFHASKSIKVDDLDQSQSQAQPGVNVPAILNNWESPSTIRSLFQQRLSLLLVCKRWNDIATKVVMPYLRLDHAYIYKWPAYFIYNAKRLHTDIYQPTCRCIKQCSCRFRPYNDGSIASLWKRALSLQDMKDKKEEEQPQQQPQSQTRGQTPTQRQLQSQSQLQSCPQSQRFFFSTEILTFQNSELKDFLNAWSRFPRLRALTIIKGMDNYPRLSPTTQSSKLFSNLVYLHIVMHLPGRVFAGVNSTSEVNSKANVKRFNLTFHHLTTLRYTFHSFITEDITDILGRDCSMPKLRHLCIESTGRSGPYISVTKIWPYVQLVGKDLSSLSIKHPVFSFPCDRIFIDCPFLVSVSTSNDITELFRLPRESVNGGLKVLVHTGTTTQSVLDCLRLMVDTHKSLEVLGTSHEWDRILGDDPQKGAFASLLSETLLSLAKFCAKRKIRFEDSRGRTMEEVRNY